MINPSSGTSGVNVNTSSSLIFRMPELSALLYMLIICGVWASTVIFPPCELASVRELVLPAASRNTMLTGRLPALKT